MKRILAGAAVLLCLGGGAFAQGGGLSDADRSYLVKERRGAAYELESAKLAASKGARAEVRQYGERLVRDHEAYNAALEQLGREQGITLPTEPEDKDKTRLADLGKLSGPAFDAAYVKEAIRINAEDKEDAAKEKAQTQNEAIRSFIAKFADMDAEHERLAKQLEK